MLLGFKIHSFALWFVQPEPLWIRLWLWSCTLEQMFSISNWQFLILCYHQNLNGDYVKHPLFQHQHFRFFCTWTVKYSHKDPRVLLKFQVTLLEAFSIRKSLRLVLRLVLGGLWTVNTLLRTQGSFQMVKWPSLRSQHPLKGSEAKAHLYPGHRLNKQLETSRARQNRLQTPSLL